MLSDIIKSIKGVQLFTSFENDKVIPPEKALSNFVFVFDISMILYVRTKKLLKVILPVLTTIILERA